MIPNSQTLSLIFFISEINNIKKEIKEVRAAIVVFKITR